MSGPIDEAGPVRETEQLDTTKLEDYLRKTIGEFQGPVAVEQFRQGHSNVTDRVRAGGRDLVLRRPPFSSKVKTAHDMNREFTVLSHLREVYGPAPRPVAFCDDESVIGAKFYLMERVKGVILRGRKPAGLEVTPEMARQCCRSFIENLADLHNLDYKAAGLEALYKPGHYAQRQVLGWCERYEGSKTDDIPDIDATAAWLKERIPEDTGAALIHNDYKFDNLVLAPDDLTRIVGVLDWEMSTIGDPLMDLGTSLSYWVEANDPDEMKPVQCFLTSAPGSLSRRELAGEYAKLTGRDVSNILFYYVFGLLKVAVIIQQIYYRYAKGATQDERFAPLIFMVRLLGQTAVRAIDKGGI